MHRLRSRCAIQIQEKLVSDNKNSETPIDVGSAYMLANPSRKAMIYLVRRCKWQLEYVRPLKQTRSLYLVMSGMLAPMSIWTLRQQVLRC